MTGWESIVALARELDRDHAKGFLDATKAQRLARAVLTFQQQLSLGVQASRPASGSLA
jgi:hypothetical protein